MSQAVSQMGSMGGRAIEVGARGGQFYRTPTGKKIYLKESTGPKSPRRIVDKNIQTGARGGQFYTSPKSGRKIYIGTGQGRRPAQPPQSTGRMTQSGKEIFVGAGGGFFTMTGGKKTYLKKRNTASQVQPMMNGGMAMDHHKSTGGPKSPKSPRGVKKSDGAKKSSMVSTGEVSRSGRPVYVSEKSGKKFTINPGTGKRSYLKS